MVDADDWAYPWKLERQVQTLQGYRNLVAVSCPVAVVNEANEIRGIRGICRSSLLVLKGSMGLEPLGICFPATVFRMDAARRAGFRPDLRAVEDWDFMIRALSGQDYAVDSEVSICLPSRPWRDFQHRMARIHVEYEGNPEANGILQADISRRRENSTSKDVF